MAEQKQQTLAGSKKQTLSGIGRVVDYLFGRNALIGVASLMLLAISGYATWSGMQDFIVGVSTSPASLERKGPAGLSVSNDFLVIAVVVALTFLMWLALRETFRPKGPRGSLGQRLITLPLYLFLALWSIGFGYGFWWSLIAGEEATRTSLQALQEDARDASAAVAARLDAVKVQLDSVVSWSDSQMAREEASGGSCGKPSGAGRGPLYNARRSVRDAIASLRTNVTNSWITPVQADLDALRKTAARLEGVTVAERQKKFEAQAGEIRSRARSIASRSDALGKSTASEMRALADSVSVAPGETGFSCYDPTLAQRLRQAAAQAEEPAKLKLRDAVFNEGPAGVANAVKRLWGNIGSTIGNLVTFIASGFHWPQGKDDGGGISGRDLIALLATIGIDFGLFVLTVLNPPKYALEDKRLAGNVQRQIRDAIRIAAQRAPGTDIEWVRRHFIHHRRASYFIIPNLSSCGDPNERGPVAPGVAPVPPDVEAARAMAMNQLAGVLVDLGLLRWPNKKEMQSWIREESLESQTDLEKIERDFKGASGDSGGKGVRNRGLLSKGQRMLSIAGWSGKALRDLEIFVLVDTEGLTPLLTVLNSMELVGGDKPPGPDEGAKSSDSDEKGA